MIQVLLIALVCVLAGFIIGFAIGNQKVLDHSLPPVEDQRTIRVLSRDVENLLDQLDQQRKQP